MWIHLVGFILYSQLLYHLDGEFFISNTEERFEKCQVHVVTVLEKSDDIVDDLAYFVYQHVDCKILE